MPGKTLDQVVKEFISIRGIYNRLGIPKSTWTKYQMRLKSGQLTYETKVYLAELAGFKRVQEELWDHPSAKQSGGE